MKDVYYENPILLLYWIVANSKWESIYDWYIMIKESGWALEDFEPLLFITTFLDILYLKEYNEKNS
jgi:hypothetical protein